MTADEIHRAIGLEIHSPLYNGRFEGFNTYQRTRDELDIHLDRIILMNERGYGTWKEAYRLMRLKSGEWWLSLDASRHTDPTLFAKYLLHASSAQEAAKRLGAPEGEKIF